ncbi:MAG: tetratricopeptide repeat protein [Deltaproteobacteria bacterium]|nr:tetratricopeptide repeat protein [Deltaproteobacteria bacterium]
MRKPYNSKSIAITIIMVVSFGVYANTLFNGFVYDDNDQILENLWIRDIRHLPDILFSSVWSFLKDRQPSVYYYRPMMYLIYLVEYRLFGPNPGGWHLVNIILHAVNGIMVFLIASMLLLPSSLSRPDRLSPADTNNLLPAFMAAIIFVIHPINSEAVAWISAVPELSFTLFSLIAFYIYMKSSVKGRGAEVASSCLLSALFLFLALLSKETAIMFPVLILAYDYLLLRPPANHPQKIPYPIFRRYLPYMFVIGVYISIRTYVLWDMVLQRPERTYLNNLQYIINTLFLIGQYFTKLLYPIDLNAFHDFRPVQSILELLDITSLPVVLSYLLLLYGTRKKGRLTFFTLAWIIIALMPALYTLGITVNPFTERYLYLPSVGFVILLIAGLIGIGQLSTLTNKAAICITIAIFLIVIGLYTTETVKRNYIWKNDITLWTDTVKKSPDSSTAHYNLGVVYQNKGLLEEAKKEYKESLRLSPIAADAHYQLGRIYTSQYLLDSAIVEFQEALRIKPDYTEAQEGLNKALYFKQLQR